MNAMPSPSQFTGPRQTAIDESRLKFVEAVRLVDDIGRRRIEMRRKANWLRANGSTDLRDNALVLGCDLPLDLYWLIDEALDLAPPAETVPLPPGRV